MIDVRIGDSRVLVNDLADKSIDCCVTSPPYWNLRNYGHPDQIGLEETPEEYLNVLLDFFDSVKLKLKDMGNCFVNLADTFYGSPSNSNASNLGNAAALGEVGRITRPKHQYLQPKSLCCIPSRFAWGMIERGWILRNEIIWNKPNHMPESVTDRLTKSHEVIYHFVKQQKYYYDLDSIREPLSSSSVNRITQKNVFNQMGGLKQNLLRGISENSNNSRCNKMVQSLAKKYQGTFEDNDNSESFSSPRARAQREKHSDNNCRTTSGLHDGRNPLDIRHPNGANPGDVWSINTSPFSGAHFAVFPLELVRRPILAGFPPNGWVLDPFAGSGTVGEFCRHNNRNAILFDLNPEYKKLIDERAMLNVPELSQWSEGI